jgi:hypothetical protein
LFLFSLLFVSLSLVFYHENWQNVNVKKWRLREAEAEEAEEAEEDAGDS